MEHSSEATTVGAGPDVAEPSVASSGAARSRSRSRVATAIWVYLAVVALYRTSLHQFLYAVPSLQYWSTVFLAIVLQALPFLVLGVAVSAAIAVLVPPSWLARAIPRDPRLAVPAAAAAATLLPGCECSAVPIAGRLISRGVPSAAALTFLLAAPAINPVVLVATAVAFPGHPEMVVARFVASLLTAVTVGWIWSAAPNERWMRRIELAHTDGPRMAAYADVASTDFLQAGGFLVGGAAMVATMQTFVPPEKLASVGGSGFVGVLLMAGLAVVLAVCSEADAFVAAGLPQFSLTARLAFLVVGPMVDLKLIALQTGTFGRRFTVRFAPLTFVVAVIVSAVVGRALL
jgi:uncharacterized protein